MMKKGLSVAALTLESPFRVWQCGKSAYSFCKMKLTFFTVVLYSLVLGRAGDALMGANRQRPVVADRGWPDG